MRSLLLPILLVPLACATTAPAQVFASIEQCDAIFGTPIASTEKTSDVRFYKHDGLTVKILFVESKAAVLTFTSLTAPLLSAEAQQKVLNDSAASQKWEEIEGENPKTWRRSDGLAFAAYDSTSGELNIFSAEYIEKSGAETQPAVHKP